MVQIYNQMKQKLATALLFYNHYLTFCSGYVVQGSNGECCFQNWDERIEMVKQTKNFADPNKLIIGGSGCECKLLKNKHNPIS